MKVKHIWFFILILASLFSTGCTNYEVEENDIDTEVRNAVLDYMEQEDCNPEFYQAYVLAGDYERKNKQYNRALHFYELALKKVIATKKEEDYVRKRISEIGNQVITH